MHAKPRPLSDIQERIHVAQEFVLAFLQVGIDTIELLDQWDQLFIRGASHHSLIQLSSRRDSPRPFNLAALGNVLAKERNNLHKLIVGDLGLALQLVYVHALDEPEHAAARRRRPLRLEFLLNLFDVYPALTEQRSVCADCRQSEHKHRNNRFPH
jgi:hypothetical protein